MVVANHIVKTGLLGKMYTICIGLMPFLMIYHFPLVKVSIVAMLSFLFLPYILSCGSRKKGSLLTLESIVTITFLLYYSYSFSAEAKNIILVSVVAIHILLAPKTLDFDLFMEVIKTFTIISSIAITIQVVVYLLTGYTVPLILNSLVLEEFDGVSGMGEETKGFIRTSGFFVEPSSYSKYALIGLSFFLFEGKMKKSNMRNAIITTTGIILSTSGMGIVGALGFWIFYILVKDDYIYKHSSKLAKSIYLIIFGSIILGALFYFSYGFQQSVLRITGDSTGYNAIEGRTSYNETYLALLERDSILFGIPDFDFEDFWAVGFIKILIASGAVGLILLIFSCVLFLFKNRMSIRINIIVYLVLLFFANIVGTMYLMFYFIMFNNNCRDEKKRFSANLRT